MAHGMALGFVPGHGVARAGARGGPAVCRARGGQGDAPARDRRAFLAEVVGAVAAAAVVARVDPAVAVDFDVDRFGDKEMKVSTINRVKQNFRNLYTENPEVIGKVMALAFADAVTYDRDTGQGGLNGSFVFEKDSPDNAPLLDAIEAVERIKEVQSDVSYADLVAFGAAVAVEVTTGPRIVVQIGREDVMEADPEVKFPLTGRRAVSQWIDVFERLGVDGAKASVLFRGGFGVLDTIGSRRAAELAEKEALNDDLLGDEDVTYGETKKKRRGAVLVNSNVSTLSISGGKFGNQYLKGILELYKKNEGSKLDPTDAGLLAHEGAMQWIVKYSSNNRQFINDFANLYEKLTLLGSRYQNAQLRDNS